ncbi:MAG TPA: ATP-binding protein [Thermoleophilia bacterium]|nr:ATP-binding protein [Thermoleophilia bacterium]
MDAPETTTPEPRRALRRRLDGDLGALGALRLEARTYLTGRHVPDDVTADIVLAIQEAAKNAVRASSGESVTVTVWVDGGAVWVRVRDRGKGLTRRGSPRCPSVWRTHGRGLCLMHALMDGVAIERSRGTRVTMHRTVTRARSA